MRTLRASEIGTFLYCQRAWWYARTGQTSENLPEMVLGSQMHSSHGQMALKAGCLQAIGLILLLAAVVVFIIYLTELWIL